ncbi:MAG: UDP-3-O-acyl-N-acetylglucosamine deacetylase [bacterium]|nr:UDP-3-O-acyl-N-acetylglucosamine deacetylase [bacterium]
MQIYTGQELERFQSGLDMVPDSEVITAPEHFRDDRLGIRRGIEYTLGFPATVGENSRTTFWNEPMDLSISPTAGDAVPRTIHNGRSYTRILSNTDVGMHNIRMGHLGILEHPSAVATALGIRFDIRAETQKPSLGLHRAMQAVGVAEDVASLPTFPNMAEPYLDAMEGNLYPIGDTNFITVNEPVGFEMDESYIVMEPDDGDGRLLIDHQISYPQNPAIGTQRIVADITPEFFAFIASARTPAFGMRSKLAQLVGKFGPEATFPYTALGMSNIVAVGTDGIVNPNTKFDTGDHNLEVLCHELIDKLGWLEAIENQYGGRFAGRITTFCTNHARDIEVARAICEQDLIIPMSIGVQQRRVA